VTESRRMARHICETNHSPKMLMKPTHKAPTNHTHMAQPENPSAALRSPRNNSTPAGTSARPIGLNSSPGAGTKRQQEPYDQSTASRRIRRSVRQ
jgi:hypothetical protein